MSKIDLLTVQVLTFINRIKGGEDGQGLAEYGLILALIAVVCVAALTALGTGIQGKLNTLVNAI